MLGLTDRADGVPAQVLGVLSDLETNLIDNPDFVRRMQGLLDELDRMRGARAFSTDRRRIDGRHQRCAVTLAGVAAPASRDTEDESHLAHAGEHQQQVIESLEEILSQLRQWDDYRRFQRDVFQLLRDQEEVAH